MPTRTYRVVYKKDETSLKWKVCSKVFTDLADAKRVQRFLGEESVIIPAETFEKIGTSYIDGCHSLHRHDRRRELEL